MAAYGTTASAGVAKILSGLLSEHNKCRGTFDQPTPGRTPDDGRSLSLSLSVGDRGSRPFHRFKFAFPARVHRASREVVSDIAPRTPRWPLCRATCLFAPKEHVLAASPSSLPSRVGVIPLDARGRCRNDGRTVKNLEAKKSWRTKIGKTFENRRGNLVLGGEIRVCHLVIFRNHAYRGGGGGIRAIQLTTDKERKEEKRG